MLEVGNIDWMRNDYACEIEIGGITYPSVEHAYQAAKHTDRNVKLQIADAFDVSAARDFGRRASLPANWDDRRGVVMSAIIRSKFANDDELGQRLAKTGSEEISQTGSDSYWGTGRDGDGENKIGEILSEIRTELQFIHNIDTDGDEESESDDYSSAPSLAEAILSNPDDELADACNDLHLGARAIMTLVDVSDFDAGYISRQTNVSFETAEDAITKLQKMQAAIRTLDDLLVTPAIAAGSDEDDDSSESSVDHSCMD